jgi:hypothetical protein
MAQREVDLKATIAALMALPGKLVFRQIEDGILIEIQDTPDSANSLAIYDDGYISVDDGYFQITVTWGSMSYWDRWDGPSLVYTGTVNDENGRLLPDWVKFLPEAAEIF